MGIKQFDSGTYKIEYIPQRLASLEAFIIACHTILSGRVSSTPLRLDLGSTQLHQANLSLFIGLAIDAGLVANRTLLNFLGLKLSNGGLVNESTAVTVEKFSLPLVPTQIACQILEPEIPATEMRKMWVETLSVASKSIAHLTEPGSLIHAARLGFASYGTANLIRREFFRATSTPEPATLLTSETEPKFGGVWDAVDPTMNVWL